MRHMVRAKALLVLMIVAASPSRASEAVFSGSLPEPRHTVTPLYPDSAWRAGLEGTSVVLVLLDRTGRVQKTMVRVSSPAFDKAAIEAAKQWRFEPAKTPEGQIVPVWYAIPFKFRLGHAATDPRVLSDSLWRDPWSSTPAVMRQQREALIRTMRNADEIWLFRLDPDTEDEVSLATARSRFDRRAILDEALVTDGTTRSKIIRLLSDTRTHARPPKLRGEHTPRLGLRFVAGPEVLDVAISFADAAMFLKDGRHLWAGSAMAHWSEWGRLAHATFPADPNFAHYIKDDPMAP
jgi:TonB family protein